MKISMRMKIVAVAVLVVLLAMFIDSAIIGRIIRLIFALGGLVFLVLALQAKIKEGNWGKRIVLRFKKFYPSRRRQKQIAVAVIVFLLFCRLIGYLNREPEMVAKSLTDGLDYRSYYYNGARVHVLEADLTKVKPVVLKSGSFATERGTLKEMAEAHENIVAAVNGDFFDEGGPIGFLASEGRLTGPNIERAALEFTGEKAEVELFRFSTTARVTANGVDFPLRKSFNRQYAAGDVGVYTHSRGIASGAGRCPNFIQARAAIITGREGDIRFSGRVIEVVENPSMNLVPAENEFIISAGNFVSVATDLGPYAWAKNNLQLGSPVEVYLPMTPKPGKEVISGAPELVRMGQYLSPEINNRILSNSRTARTLVGINRSGNGILAVVIEGSPKWWSIRPNELMSLLARGKFKVAYGEFKKGMLLFGRAFGMRSGEILGLKRVSHGATLCQTAHLMLKETALSEPIYSVINLDGGASTTMVASEDGEFSIKNTLMENRPRRLVNGLGFQAND